jgi:hypothetical protein
MNIFLLLYADDTVQMAETPKDLQKQLHIFHDYCLAWKLKVNIDKTKIVNLPSHPNHKYIWLRGGDLNHQKVHFR